MRAVVAASVGSEASERRGGAQAASGGVNYKEYLWGRGGNEPGGTPGHKAQS